VPHNTEWSESRKRNAPSERNNNGLLHTFGHKLRYYQSEAMLSREDIERKRGMKKDGPIAHVIMTAGDVWRIVQYLRGSRWGIRCGSPTLPRRPMHADPRRGRLASRATCETAEDQERIRVAG